MSDGAITAIVSGLITITTLIVGFLTLWVKLRYGVEKATEAVEKAQAVSEKVDHNTHITTQCKAAADKASEHAEACDEERLKLLRSLADHDVRITALESQIGAMRVSVESVSKNVDSSRHEMRGHLQTLTNKLDLIALNAKVEPK